MDRFDAPGFLNDFNDEQKIAWSNWISEQLNTARDEDGGGELENYGPRPQFFNPLETPPADDAVEKDISWTAFPRIVKLDFPSDQQRWQRSDSTRDVQDEYCEWSVTRDPQSNKITKVTFTSEGPEYWQFLGQVNPGKVLSLYREHISQNVQESDLFSNNGQYMPRNKWNNSTSHGAMHLIQRNNTFSAEIELAAAAVMLRERNGKLLTGEKELIKCVRYGQEDRHSDPFIGSQVNELARQKAFISLANPVGLCIAGLSVVGWQTPDGSDPYSYWKVTRGTAEKSLRAVYEIPNDKGFTVSDIKINGKAIMFGGQIADFIQIKLTGLATRFGQSTVTPMKGCVQRAAALAQGAVAHIGGPAFALVKENRPTITSTRY